MTPEKFHELFLKATNSRSGWMYAHGYCFQYAYCFINLVGGQAISYLTQKKYSKAHGHCFIKYNDKFYDSENCEGQVNWKRLQSYLKTSSDKKLTKHRSMKGLANKWFRPQDFTECDKIINNIKIMIEKENNKVAFLSKN